MDIVVKVQSDNVLSESLSWDVKISVELTENEKKGNLTNILENLKNNFDKLKDCLNQPFQQNPIEHIYFYGIR